jgi:uncharacterized membrane protein
MKNIFKFRKLLVLLAFSLMFASCLTNVDEEIQLDPCSEITFNINVKPIIDNNCTVCHSTAGAQFPNLETYEGVKANASKIKSEVETLSMPIGGSLTTDEIQAISCWVEAGALNN